MVARLRPCEPGVMSYRDTCLACGEPLAPILARAGSLRCHDCRARRAPLRAEVVEQARPAAEPGAVVQLPARGEQLGLAA
jgi:hypothetical protein